ncbi:hypothetical protein [Flavobacterium urumqiense]|nr:hypothetical protein [Flavobacterium urumqiense]
MKFYFFYSMINPFAIIYDFQLSLASTGEREVFEEYVKRKTV